MAGSNYISSGSVSENYYKVSFVTTHSNNIPKKMKQTGALIIMDNVVDRRKSLWFRGDLVASGYGFSSAEEMELSTYFINHIGDIFGGPNGMYDFITGYEGPDGSKGKNLHDRFSYQEKFNTDSYRNLYDIISYTYKWTGDLQEYAESTYSYTLHLIESTYSDLITYITENDNKIENNIQKIYNQGKKALAYLNNHNNVVYADICTYIRDTYQKCWDTDTYIYNRAYAYVGQMTDLMHKYVDRSIDKLVGGAPETIDTLGEISHLLQEGKKWGLDMVDYVNQIMNSYITHYPIVDDSCYTYMNQYTYHLVPEKHKGYMTIEEGPQHQEDLEKWEEIVNEWHKYSEEGDIDGFYENHEEYTYTYYTYTIGTTGFTALTSDQVSCVNPFGDYQLTYLLKKILPPYPYEIPEVLLDRGCEYDLNHKIVEYGSLENLDVNIKYLSKDASTTEIIYIDDSESKQSIYGVNSEKQYYTNSKTGYWGEYNNAVFSLGAIYYNTYPLKTLKKVKVEYGKSNQMVYPEIKDILGIKDEEHIIPAGEIEYNIFEGVKIQTRYKMFNWFDTDKNVSNPENQSLLNNKPSKFITSEEMRTEAMFGDKTALYLAIPTALINNILSLKLQNYETEICQELYNNAITSPEYTFEKFDFNYYNPGILTIPYTIFKYSTNRFYIDEGVRFKIEFKSIGI